MRPPIRLRGDDDAFSGRTPRWLLANTDDEEVTDSKSETSASKQTDPEIFQHPFSEIQSAGLDQRESLISSIELSEYPVELTELERQINENLELRKEDLDMLAKNEKALDLALRVLKKFVETGKYQQTRKDLAICYGKVLIAVLIDQYSKCNNRITRLQHDKKKELESLVKVFEGIALISLVKSAERVPADQMKNLAAELVKLEVDVNGTDGEGRTAVHHLAELSGYEIVVYILLGTGKVDLDQTDNDDKTPLQVAVDKRIDKMTTLLLQHTKEEKIREQFSSDANFYDLIHSFHERDLKRRPTSTHKKTTKQAVMTVLDACWKKPETEAGMDVVYFKPLNEKKNGETAYALLARLGVADYLNHGVVKKLSSYKWERVRWFYWASVVANIGAIGFLAAAAFLSVISANPASYQTPMDARRAACEGFALFWILCIIVQEVWQCRTYKMDYCRDGWNILEIGIIILASTLVILRIAELEAQWVIYSFLYLISVFRLVKFFATNEYLLTYVWSIMKMWKEFAAFLLLCIVLLVGCVGAFFIGYRVHDKTPEANNTVADNKDRNGTRLGQLQQLLISSSRILIDEDPAGPFYNEEAKAYQFGEIETYYPTIILLALTFITTIVLLNVLIAQLAHKYRLARIRGKRASWSKIAWIISKCERKYSFFTKVDVDSKKVGRKIKSVEKFSEFKALNDRIDGLHDRIDGLRDRIDGLHDRIDGSTGRLSQMDDRGKSMEEAIKNLMGKTENVETELSKKLNIFQENSDKQNRILKEQFQAMTDNLKECFENLGTKLEQTMKTVEEMKQPHQIETSPSDLK